MTVDWNDRSPTKVTFESETATMSLHNQTHSRRFVGRGKKFRTPTYGTALAARVRTMVYSERLYRDYCNDSTSRRAASNNLFNDMICGPVARREYLMRQRRKLRFVPFQLSIALFTRYTSTRYNVAKLSRERTKRVGIKIQSSNDKRRQQRVRIVVIREIRREGAIGESRRNSTDGGCFVFD